jgi:hypothetical protein
LNAPAKTPADAVLEALADALAPRVAALLQARANDTSDDGLAELLARTGYEIAPDEAHEIGAAGVAKTKPKRKGRAA